MCGFLGFYLFCLFQLLCLEYPQVIQVMTFPESRHVSPRRDLSTANSSLAGWAPASAGAGCAPPILDCTPLQINMETVLLFIRRSGELIQANGIYTRGWVGGEWAS